jgi:hypothetical protein
MAEEEPGTAAEMSSPMCETAGPGNSLPIFPFFLGVVDPDPKHFSQGRFRKIYSGSETESDLFDKKILIFCEFVNRVLLLGFP